MLKIRKMIARPKISIDLAIPNAGFVAAKNSTLLQLGSQIPLNNAFDKYSIIQSIKYLRADFLKVHYPNDLDKLLKPYLLLKGDNARQGATLEKTIAEASKFYYEKISSLDENIRIYESNYIKTATNPETIPVKRQEHLDQILERREQLIDQYNKLGTNIIDATENITYQRGIRTFVPEHRSNHVNPYNHRTLVAYTYHDTVTQPQVWTGASWEDLQSSSPVVPIERVETKSGELRFPKLDADIEALQYQIQAMEKLEDDLIFAEKVKNLKNIWLSHFDGLLADIVHAQKNYIDTYLVSTNSGTITAINKDLGEYFQAGEPIIRVEDPSNLYFVGIINAKDLMKIDDKFILTCNDLYDAKKNLVINLTIRSVRGHESDNDEWDVIFEAPNVGGLIPLNYTFDVHNCTLLRH
ncbi:MAG: HlyD family secretion protein [Sneathiella sp.]